MFKNFQWYKLVSKSNILHRFFLLFWKDSTNFRHWKMTLKLRILTRLFKILVSLSRSLFNEKMLISKRCISSLMSTLIKKSWIVSNAHAPSYNVLSNKYIFFTLPIFVSHNVGREVFNLDLMDILCNKITILFCRIFDSHWRH